MKTVFDVLNARIDYDENEAVVIPAPTPEPTPEPTPAPTPTIDWSAQNLVDTQQQAEIDALKVELALLKATPRTETSTGLVKNQSTFGRHFNRTIT